MAGIALLMDLLRKNPSLNGQTLHSTGLYSATLAASAAAASVAAGTPFASRALFGFSGRKVACCDAGAPPINEDFLTGLRTASETVFRHDSLNYSTKEYYIELKPLFSAFQLRSFTLTSLRSFALFYLPLLGPRVEDEDDDNFLQGSSEEQQVDLITPFKKSVKQIVRETTVVTTRRVLERLAIHYASQRMAWKLLKDVPKSAVRKADRGMPFIVYFYSVSRTTFRGHFLGVAASWLVQVGIEFYRFFSGVLKSNQGVENDDKAHQVKFLGKKIYGTTVRCGASLVFASIGAGIGATLFRPSSGQSIGCLIGDLAGPIIISFCFEEVFHLEL